MRLTRTLALMIAASGAGIMPCGADDAADAQAAFDRKDYATALRLWEPMAEQGDAQAQLGVGLLYLQGMGVARDVERGMTWLELDAEAGDLRGPLLLGLAYESGNGVAIDRVQAYAWWEIAHSLSRTKTDLATVALFLSHADDDMTPEQVAAAKRIAEQWRAAHPDLVASP